MIIGDYTTPRSYPTVQIPQWDPLDNNGHPNFPSSPIHSPYSPSVNVNSADHFNDFAVVNLHRYFPSNENTGEFDSLSDSDSDLPPIDAFSCDYFRMYEFKIRPCVRGRSHDWTDCPYAHHGEKARRRDPRKYHYSGTPCPEFRKGFCPSGDLCEFAHGVFECWLHPARYRTQPCKDGVACSRKICFFAHTADQLRLLPQQQLTCNDGSKFVQSPTSILASPLLFHASDSPPMSPRFNSVTELGNSMRRLQIGNVKNCLFGSGSPRGSMLRPGVSQLDMWKNMFEDEPAMERVESGRDLRTKIYAKLSKDNSLD